jgi:hypothetical protein
VLGESCPGETALGEAPITLAPTAWGRAAQLALHRAELTPGQRERWGPLLDKLISEYQRSGRPEKAARSYLEEQLAAGRKLTPALRKETAATVRCDLSTVSRAIQKIRKSGTVQI